MANPVISHIQVATKVEMGVMEENDPVLDFLRRSEPVVIRSHNGDINDIFTDAVKKMALDPKEPGYGGYGINPVTSPQESYVRVDATILISTRPRNWDIDPSVKNGWYPNQPLGTLQNVGHPAFRPLVVSMPPLNPGGERVTGVSRQELPRQWHHYMGEPLQQSEDRLEQQHLHQHLHQRQFPSYQFQPTRTQKHQRTSTSDTEDTPRKRTMSSNLSGLDWGAVTVNEGEQEQGSKESLEQFLPSLPVPESGDIEASCEEDDIPSSMLNNTAFHDADGPLFHDIQ